MVINQDVQEINKSKMDHPPQKQADHLVASITLIGPFREVVSFKQAPLTGALSEKDLGIIQEGAVVVDSKGFIVEVGTFRALQAKYAGLAHCAYYPIQADQVLLPGYIDAHTHILFAGSRARDYSMRLQGKSYLEIAETGGGIMETVRATRAASDADLQAAFYRRILKMHQGGVTTVEVKSGYGLTVEQELRMLSLLNRQKQSPEMDFMDIVPTCLAAHMNPPDGCFAGHNPEYLQALATHLLPQIKAMQLAKRVDIFVEETAFSIQEARRYLSTARDMGFSLTVHADQFTPGAAALAVAMGAVSADHLEGITEDGINTLAASHTVATVLPGACLGLGIKQAPARQLLDAGAILAIASDWNPGSAPMGLLLTQASLLSVYEKLNMAETLAGICFRAAAALGLSDRGRLMQGQLADMQAYPVKDYREILYNQGQLKPAIIWKKSIPYDQ